MQTQTQTQGARKWTTEAGPRQTKNIQKALSAIRSEGTTQRTLTGVKGVTEGINKETSHCSMILFGTPRAETGQILTRIAETYDYRITRENHKAILADLEAGLEELKGSRPTIDERRTPEEDKERNEAVAAAQAKRDEERAQKDKENEAKAREWAKEYGHLETSERTNKSSWALAASNMRRELAQAFPGQEFSAKSESYSGGSSIDVRWVDGPTEEEVRKISRRYHTASFDGMTDTERYCGTHWNEVYGGVKYVFEHREVSQARLQEAAEGLGKGQGPNDAEVLRLVREQSFYTAPERPTGPVEATAGPSGIVVTVNEEKNGVEIRFPSRPEQEILTALKARRWRWSRRNKCWYHKRDGQALEYAQSLAAA